MPILAKRIILPVAAVSLAVLAGYLLVRGIRADDSAVQSVGILVASGLIAGEALTGLVFGWFRYKDIPVPSFFKEPSYLAGLAVLLVLAFVIIRLPLSKAGRPEDPAPPGGKALIGATAAPRSARHHHPRPPRTECRM